MQPGHGYQSAGRPGHASAAISIRPVQLCTHSPRPLMPVLVHYTGPAMHSHRSVHRLYSSAPAVHGHRYQHLDTPYCTRYAPTAHATDAGICTPYRPGHRIHVPRTHSQQLDTPYYTGHASAAISTPPVRLHTRSTWPPLPVPGHTILYRACTHSLRD